MAHSENPYRIVLSRTMEMDLLGITTFSGNSRLCFIPSFMSLKNESFYCFNLSSI